MTLSQLVSTYKDRLSARPPAKPQPQDETAAGSSVKADVFAESKSNLESMLRILQDVDSARGAAVDLTAKELCMLARFWFSRDRTTKSTAVADAMMADIS